MTTNLMPLVKQQFNQNGSPVSGGKLFVYLAGTTTKATTFTDSTGSTPNTNPVILDSNGQASVWLSPTQFYKFVLSPPTDTDPPTNPYWTVDNVISPSPIVVGNMTDEKGSGGTFGFAAGVDFTAGTTTTLTLSTNYGSAANLWVAFDGTEQGADSFSLSGTTLTFNSPIPAGTSKVYVKGGTTLTIGAPANATVTDASVAPGSKLYDRINDMVSLSDFGVDKTGATSAVAALNLALVSSRSVFIPAGTYLIDGPVGNLTDLNGYQLLGIGADQVTFLMSGATANISASGPNIRITGINFKAVGIPTSAVTLGGTSQNSGSSVDNCTFTASSSANYFAACISLYYTWYTNISDNYFLGSSELGVGIQGYYSVNNTVTRNRALFLNQFINWSATVNPNGSNVCEGWIISANVVPACNTFFAGNAGLLPQIVGNIIDICTNIAIFSLCTTTIINDNWIAAAGGSTSQLINLNSPGSNIVSGNYIQGNNASNSPEVILQVSSSNNNVVTGNVFFQGTQAITFVGTCGFATITGNVFLSQTVRPCDLTNAQLSKYDNTEVNVVSPSLFNSSVIRPRIQYTATQIQTIPSGTSYSFTFALPANLFSATPIAIVGVGDGTVPLMCTVQASSSNTSQITVYVTAPGGGTFSGAVRFNLIAMSQ